MHVELVLPALFTVPGGPSLPAAERVLARARRTTEERQPLEAWLGEAFDLGLEDRPLPAGALTALASGAEPGTRPWLRADPVHLRADRDRALLLPNEAFALAEDEAEGLARSLVPLLEPRFHLHRAAPTQWCLEVREGEAAGASARAPIDLAGADVDRNLPDKAWHPLLTELQMAMYDHPVNTAREARGEPVVNSVWFWGEGPLPVAARGPWHSVTADYIPARGLAQRAGLRHRDLPEGAGAWLERAPEDGRHLIVLEALRGVAALGDAEGAARRLAALEAQWIAPLLEALKSDRLGMLTLHVPDAGDRFELVRGDLRRFWRRPRPLAAYARADAP